MGKNKNAARLINGIEVDASFNTTIKGGLTVNKVAGVSIINFPSGNTDPGFIKHEEISADVTRLIFSVSDNDLAEDYFAFGNILGGSFNERFKIFANGDIEGKAAAFNGGSLSVTGASIQPFLRIARTGTGIRSYYWGINGGGTLFLQDETSATTRLQLSTAGLFTMDAAFTVNGAVQIGPLSGTTASFTNQLTVNGKGVFNTGIECVINTGNAANFIEGNTNAQGTSRRYEFIKAVPVVSSGTQLIIPFISQGALSHQILVNVEGISSQYNNSIPTAGFKASFSVTNQAGGTLGGLTNLGTSGNVASIAISGLNIIITFTTAYTNATANGIMAYFNYITVNDTISLNRAGIVMN